jgi:shikimate dehydrogenase
VGRGAQGSAGAMSGREQHGCDMRREITKDTRLCMSLAGTPSNIGTRFHNYLYGELGLDYIYKAFTTTELGAAIGGIRALGIRGCGVSMPFKEACMHCVDALDESAEAIQSVNTIVNSDGFLRAYNTDYIAVRRLLAEREIGVTDSFAVRGSGGMAKAVVAALHDSGFVSGTVIARNLKTGPALAAQYGYDWQPELQAHEPQLLVNATPLGMAAGPAADDLAFPREAVEAARGVIDVVATPANTPLVRIAKELRKTVITGADVIKLQALEQFDLYTGVRPTDEQAERASQYSRA